MATKQMNKSAKPDSVDPEIQAISELCATLQPLEPEAQVRVIEYVVAKLKIPWTTKKGAATSAWESEESVTLGTEMSRFDENEDDEPSIVDGISPVAKRWMRRNGLSSDELSRIFSLGVDEIDLVTKKVPGKNKKDRMRSVFLLKGVAAYLGAGTARFTHEQVKEACLHYDAYDVANFAAYLKSLNSEVSGNKGSGYILTARGLSDATVMVKELLKAEITK